MSIRGSEQDLSFNSSSVFGLHCPPLCLDLNPLQCLGSPQSLVYFEASSSWLLLSGTVYVCAAKVLSVNIEGRTGTSLQGLLFPLPLTRH